MAMLTVVSEGLYLTMILALIAALLGLACSPGTAERRATPSSSVSTTERPNADSGPAPALRARSAYTTIAASSSPLWAALDAGYFREQGLEIELVHIEPGAPLMAAMHNGEVDVVGVGASNLVLGYLQGLDPVIFGSTSNTMDVVVFAQPEIQRIDDLRGKTIGVSRLKALTDVAARLGLQRAGLQPDVDVFMRGTGGLAESLAAMETRALDGASLSAPVVFEARKQGYREILNLTEMDIPFMGTAISATRRVLDERPAVAERYLRALAQAVSRLRTEPDFAIQIIGKYSNNDNRELLATTVDYYRPLYQRDIYPDPRAVQTILDMEDNPAARTTRPEDMIDFRFADELRSSGFLEQLPR
jgi:ABC-type nitrate/sulfonate/bicarbonate transport system substrate-binding protein